MMENGGAFGCLFRRKPVDAARQKPATQQLARKLSLFDLTAIAPCHGFNPWKKQLEEMQGAARSGGTAAGDVEVTVDFSKVGAGKIGGKTFHLRGCHAFPGCFPWSSTKVTICMVFPSNVSESSVVPMKVPILPNVLFCDILVSVDVEETRKSLLSCTLPILIVLLEKNLTTITHLVSNIPPYVGLKKPGGSP
ncbi:hypothetical protein CQW23_03337 [Capsicum baccatum]|uniref:Uncharacterized protein n=1 Tax=Capsicum baccatum TaxID=33114 RepID=A0A2G2XBX3_CAPBA|nr:hypothetical protein CQW23_03337 [Capsicum baccatum]